MSEITIARAANDMRLFVDIESTWTEVKLAGDITPNHTVRNQDNTIRGSGIYSVVPTIAEFSINFGLRVPRGQSDTYDEIMAAVAAREPLLICVCVDDGDPDDAGERYEGWAYITQANITGTGDGILVRDMVASPAPVDDEGENPTLTYYPPSAPTTTAAPTTTGA